jgi:hypothetical protein
MPTPIAKGLAKTSSKVVLRFSHIQDIIADMHSRRQMGHTPSDVTLLGPHFLMRLADMLGRLADITSDGLMCDISDTLSRAVAWHDDGYYRMSALLGETAAYEASLRVRREFDYAWEWLYDNMFAPSGSHRRPCDSDRFSIHADEGAIDLEKVMGDIGRFAGGEPTMADLRALPHGELVRLSVLLGEFAETTEGWPEVYGNRPALAKVGADWEDSRYWNILGGIRKRDYRDAMERVTEEGSDGVEHTFYRIKTNRQMGLAFSAWTEDCHEASRIFGFWGDGMAGDESARMLVDVMTEDEKDDIWRRCEEAWKWLGDYIFMMTC